MNRRAFFHLFLAAACAPVTARLAERRTVPYTAEELTQLRNLVDLAERIKAIADAGSMESMDKFTIALKRRLDHPKWKLRP